MHMKQPDFLVWNSKSILVFEGEEKEKTEDFQLAKDELIEKYSSMCELFFGSIPFLFCYAAAGRFIQFFIIDRQSNITPTTANYFDMSNPESRLRIVSTVLNITWCINEYQNYTIKLFSFQSYYNEKKQRFYLF